MYLRIVLAAMALLAISLHSPRAAAEETAPAPLDTFIRQQMEEGRISGLGAAIIVGRKVVWMKGYGFADRERRVPFTPDTVMNVGSIAKTFTGVALMRAVEEGKLSLDDDINAHLPFKVVNPYFPDAKITLRQLATHTSAISDRWEVYESTYHFGGDAPQDLGEFLKSYLVPGGKNYAKENFIQAKPGTHREYSNIGAGLAGYIIELAVGEKLNAYTKRHIFTPLQMKNTGWFLSEIPPGRHSKLYVAQNGITIPIELYGGTTYPDGGVRTSVADLSKLFIALLNEGEFEGVRILRKSSVDEMLRFHYTAANKPANVSLDKDNAGIFWQTKFSVTRIGHGGSDPGLKTEMLAELSKESGVILFSNTSLSDEDLRYYVAILRELMKRAEEMKKAR